MVWLYSVPPAPRVVVQSRTNMMYYKFSASWHVRDHKSRTDFWSDSPHVFQTHTWLRSRCAHLIGCLGVSPPRHVCRLPVGMPPRSGGYGWTLQLYGRRSTSLNRTHIHTEDTTTLTLRVRCMVLVHMHSETCACNCGAIFACFRSGDATRWTMRWASVVATRPTPRAY
jgi:hypothetical protein